MPVFSDDFEDPTPLPDPEHSKVPTTQRTGQSGDDPTGSARTAVPSTGSPADALHPERTAATAAGKNPDDAKSGESALAAFRKGTDPKADAAKKS